MATRTSVQDDQAGFRPLLPGPGRHWRRWLDRRIPPAREVRLHQRNLFIFLSRRGGAYLLVTALVWVGATNYQNNLIHALCFYLLALLFVVIHQTFANLSGLRLRFDGAEPVFAGAIAGPRIELISANARQQLELGFPGESRVTVSTLPGQPVVVALPVTTRRRGRCRPGRFRLASNYPMGLIRCWTWLDLDIEVLVYPQPLAGAMDAYAEQGAEDSGKAVAGSEDFIGLRPWVPGDALSRVSWKHQASGHGLLVREQVDYRDTERWLDFDRWPGADPELRLSWLCHAALRLAADNRAFGLRLPGLMLPPATGDDHLRQVLRALAEHVS